jgi:hypothetical protein
MKILPYSVLAATMIGGMLPGASPKTFWADDSGNAFSTEAISGTQEETKPKDAKSGAAGEPNEGVSEIPAGTLVYAEIPKTLDAKKAKPGDEVVARATLAVVSQGKIAIPSGGKIFGHITEAAALSGKDGRSKLGILFDHVLLVGGKIAPISLTVQAIGRRTVAGNAENPGEPGNAEMYPPQPHPVVSSPHVSNGQTPTDPIPHTLPAPELGKSVPALDSGSHGVVGMPDVSLVETKEHGTTIESAKRTVKLESGTEILLRVVAAEDEGAGKP